MSIEPISSMPAPAVPPAVVADLMSRDLVTASPELALEDALHLMLRQHVRHLLVLDGQRLLGMVTDRDLTAYRGLPRHAVPARLAEVVCPARCVCTPLTPLHVAARDMLRRGCDATIVLDGDRPVGIFTSVDALRCLAG